MKIDWKSMLTAPKGVHDRILLTDGEDVFIGYFYNGRFIKESNEKLAFPLGWSELPDPIETIVCEACDRCGETLGKTCEVCEGNICLRIDGQKWGYNYHDL